MNTADMHAIADEVLGVLGTGQQISSFSRRYPDFDLDAAYRVAHRVRDMRLMRSEHPVGRKIGFTNQTVWKRSGLSKPIWNYVFDTTVINLADIGNRFSVGIFASPRLEPELILHVAQSPQPGMNDEELLNCVDWVAPGFEVVHSIFPDWEFTVADAVAAFGLHGALLLASRRYISSDLGLWKEAIANFSLTLADENGLLIHGSAGNVLGGPLKALRYLVEELCQPTDCPVEAGELVATGTLTAAMPIDAGQFWAAEFTGINLPRVTLAID